MLELNKYLCTICNLTGSQHFISKADMVTPFGHIEQNDHCCVIDLRTWLGRLSST